ncbi:LysE family transporter [Solibacillus sp. FSL H8-0538]|uniref:LysE family transporter n=1 Tax=Solibacillus sp. FSL H8-0538 TaxID=2921400 RepID=UPI0030FB5997
MNPFFSYILLGVSLSAAVGPINVAQINRGIKYGFLNSWLVGLGAMFGDVIFMFLIYFGLAQYLTTPYMKLFLWLLGFFVLVWTGVESILGAKKPIQKDLTINESMSKSFRTGFVIALSNPLNIIFWLGLYGSVLAKTSDLYSNEQLLFYSSGIFLGVFMWDIFMAGVASSFRKFMNSRALQFITIGAGLSLIGFGLYFGYQAYTIIFK